MRFSDIFSSIKIKTLWKGAYHVQSINNNFSTKESKFDH
jgi:hypothetical protein